MDPSMYQLSPEQIQQLTSGYSFNAREQQLQRQLQLADQLRAGARTPKPPGFMAGRVFIPDYATPLGDVLDAYQGRREAEAAEQGSQALAGDRQRMAQDYFRLLTQQRPGGTPMFNPEASGTPPGF